MRLNRYLASAGLGSRRGVEELILSGRVRLNGEVVTNLGTQVTAKDEVAVNGRKVSPQGTVVVALHKPKGYVCTRDDEEDRRTLYDLLPKDYQTLHHVGRLDMDSSGLILLTNDGDLSHTLTHPSKGIEKEYEVTVEEPLDEATPGKLIKGMMTPEGFGRAERSWLIGNYKIGIVLKQGLKRQIRHMLYSCGHEVRRLVRVRIGHLYLKGMREGGWRELTKAETEKLKSDAAYAASRPDRPHPSGAGGDDKAKTESDRPRRGRGKPTKGGPRGWSIRTAPDGASKARRAAAERPAAKRVPPKRPTEESEPPDQEISAHDYFGIDDEPAKAPSRRRKFTPSKKAPSARTRRNEAADQGHAPFRPESKGPAKKGGAAKKGASARKSPSSRPGRRPPPSR